MVWRSVVILVIFISIIVIVFTLSSKPFKKIDRRAYPIEFVKKAEWGGQPATGIKPLNTPVPVVIIHHTYLPEACWSKQECGRAMISMQNTHQQSNGWVDIGYNFAVGSDNVVYEGRGWHAVGAHTMGYNSRSVGIVFIGNWEDKSPPPKQIQAAQDLIALGIELGYIQQNYKLRAHRQFRASDCPGSGLYENLKSWPHFSEDEVL